MPGRNTLTQFCRPKFTCFHQIWREKKRKTVTEYGHNSWSRNHCWAYNIPNRSSFRALQICRDEIRQLNFLSQNSLVFVRLGLKKRKTVTEYGHNSWSRNRCRAYNIQNRSSFWPLQIYRDEICQPNFLGQNSLVFIRFGGKKTKNCDWIRP